MLSWISNILNPSTRSHDWKISTSKSHERARIAGLKKVNAIKDGFLILVGMIKLFFFK